MKEAIFESSVYEKVYILIERANEENALCTVKKTLYERRECCFFNTRCGLHGR